MDQKFFDVYPFKWVAFEQLEYEKNWLASGGDRVIIKVSSQSAELWCQQGKCV